MASKKQQEAMSAIGSMISKETFDLTKERQNDFSDLERGNIRPTGVGLREGEIEALDAIGAAVGVVLDAGAVARNALIRIAVRDLLEAYLTGKLTAQDIADRFNVPDKPKPKLNL